VSKEKKSKHCCLFLKKILTILIDSSLNFEFQISLTKRVEEGFCELLAYLWMTELEIKLSQPLNLSDDAIPSAAENLDNTQKHDALLKYVKIGDIRFHKKRIEENVSSIYGDGFRDAIEALKKGWSLTEIILYARKMGSYPACEYDMYLQTSNVPLLVQNITAIAGFAKRSIKYCQSVVVSGISFLFEGTGIGDYALEFCSKIVQLILDMRMTQRLANEHRQIIVRFINQERSLYICSKNATLSQLRESIRSRFDDIDAIAEAFAVSCNGTLVKHDEDVQSLKERDVIEVSLI